VGTLKIGRVGLDVDLNDPQEINLSGREDVRSVDISGFLRDTTLARTKVLRGELLAQVGRLVPVVYTTDADLNGMAILDRVDIDMSHRDASLQSVGFIRFSVGVTYLGAYSELEFQSLLSMVDAAEDFSTTPSFWHSPPVGALAYSAGGGAPTLIERPTEDGDIFLAYDVPANTHPTWSVDPAAYYDGAVELWVDDRLRAGRDMPMSVTGWLINGKTMQVREGGFGSTSTGRIEFRVHDGTSWGTWVSFRIDNAGANTIDAWHFVTCIRNDAEAVTVRLVRDAAEDSATTAKHELDITVRRGCRLVSCVYKYDGIAGTHEVRRHTASAATRPAGPASYITFDTLIDGDRWALGCPKAFTEDTTNGGITLTSGALNMPFWVAVAVDNESTGAGNGPGDLAQQFVGQVAESVRAVRR